MLIGYDKEGYEEAVEWIKVCLVGRVQPVYVDLQPGDGTAYRMLLVPLSRSYSLHGEFPSGTDEEYVWVSTESWGSYQFHLGQYKDPGYVDTKLRFENKVAATAVALFLNDVFGGWPDDEDMHSGRQAMKDKTSVYETHPQLFERPKEEDGAVPASEATNVD